MTKMPLRDFRSVHLPYCLKRLENGRYIVLNREYKPLGFQTKDFLKYEDYPIAIKFKGLTKRVAAQLSHKGDEDLTAIFLYSDSSIPTDTTANMTSYLGRLAILAKLKFEPPEGAEASF